MAKYSFDFKKKVVLDYLDGRGGYPFLAKNYGIPSENQVKRWVHAYQTLGDDGLKRKLKNDCYSVQFKLHAIELYQTTEMSYQELANALGMNNPTLLTKWMIRYREAGPEGLSRPKGRPPTMKKKKSEEPTKKSTLNDQERIKELEKKVRTLEIQNAFLKELRKLRKMEAQQRRKNQLHESSPASEDHSN